MNSTTNAVRAACPSAEEFDAARKAAGVTVAEAARLLGIDKATLQRFTTGKVAYPSNLVAQAITKQYKRWLKNEVVA